MLIEAGGIVTVGTALEGITGVSLTPSPDSSANFGEFSLHGWVEGNFNVAREGVTGLPAADTSQNGWVGTPRAVVSSADGAVKLEVAISLITTPDYGSPGPYSIVLRYTPLTSFTRQQACDSTVYPTVMVGMSPGYSVNVANSSHWWPEVCTPNTEFVREVKLTFPEPVVYTDPVRFRSGLEPTVYYYRPGDPRRAPDILPESGTLTRGLDCMDSSGNVQHLISQIPVSILDGASTPVPELVCPAGSVAVGYDASWTPQGGVPTQILPPTSAPDWVVDIPTTYPACLTETCYLELFRNTESGEESCGDFAEGCADWYVDEDRDSKFECHWGPYTVELRFCSTFREPGKALSNATFNDANEPGVYVWPRLSDPKSQAELATNAAIDWQSRKTGPSSLRGVARPESDWRTLRIAADECIKQGIAVGSSLAASAANCESLPVYLPAGLDGFGREVAMHTQDVLTVNPAWWQLNYMPGAQKALTGVSRTWYGQAAFACPDRLPSREAGSVTQCDEFPMYATVQGGPGAYMQTPLVLQRVSAGDNGAAGSAYSAMLTSCGVVPTPAGAELAPPEGSEFLVVPLPEMQVMSFFICGENSPAA